MLAASDRFANRTTPKFSGGSQQSHELDMAWRNPVGDTRRRRLPVPVRQVAPDAATYRPPTFGAVPDPGR
ncbi:hypothetical protein MDOR_09740 [Mycolicibacterium doricum]|uniref:Uncharacterized protein n=1 Tax=Mycolicibacterium doricum TaxID=126673 RepID=A0A7I7VR05_9MYCO|nr:hypothetical protein MDOR_09740 [Mycolicibacterium doricum]